MANTQESILHKLQASFDVEAVDVVNESGQHNVPAGSQTHFRVLLVARDFEGHPRVQRHRAVHRVLEDELGNGVHALALDAWTPDEWRERGQPSISPACLGGGTR